MYTTHIMLFFLCWSGLLVSCATTSKRVDAQREAGLALAQKLPSVLREHISSFLNGDTVTKDHTAWVGRIDTGTKENVPVAMSPTEKLSFVRSIHYANNTFHIVDNVTGESMWSIELPKVNADTAVFSPNGRYFASVTGKEWWSDWSLATKYISHRKYKPRVRIVDLHSKKEIYDSPANYTSPIKFSPDGNLLVFSKNKNVRCVDIVKRKEKKLSCSSENLTSFVLHPSQKQVVCCYNGDEENNRSEIWDIDKDKKVSECNGRIVYFYNNNEAFVQRKEKSEGGRLVARDYNLATHKPIEGATTKGTREGEMLVQDVIGGVPIHVYTLASDPNVILYTHNNGGKVHEYSLPGSRLVGYGKDWCATMEEKGDDVHIHSFASLTRKQKLFLNSLSHMRASCGVFCSEDSGIKRPAIILCDAKSTDKDQLQAGLRFYGLPPITRAIVARNLGIVVAKRDDVVKQWDFCRKKPLLARPSVPTELRALSYSDDSRESKEMKRSGH